MKTALIMVRKDQLQETLRTLGVLGDQHKFIGFSSVEEMSRKTSDEFDRLVYIDRNLDHDTISKILEVYRERGIDGRCELVVATPLQEAADSAESVFGSPVVVPAVIPARVSPQQIYQVCTETIEKVLEYYYPQREKVQVHATSVTVDTSEPSPVSVSSPSDIDFSLGEEGSGHVDTGFLDSTVSAGTPSSGPIEDIEVIPGVEPEEVVEGENLRKNLGSKLMVISYPESLDPNVDNLEMSAMADLQAVLQALHFHDVRGERVLYVDMTNHKGIRNFMEEPTPFQGFDSPIVDGDLHIIGSDNSITQVDMETFNNYDLFANYDRVVVGCSPQFLSYIDMRAPNAQILIVTPGTFAGLRSLLSLLTDRNRMSDELILSRHPYTWFMFTDPTNEFKAAYDRLRDNAAWDTINWFNR